MAGDFEVVGGQVERLDAYSQGVQDFFAVNRAAANASKGDADDLEKTDLEDRQVKVLVDIMSSRIAEFGLENFISNSDLELLSRVAYIKERVHDAEKLIFTNDDNLKEEHLTFIANCCKERKDILILQISQCTQVGYENLKALDGIDKIDLHYKR